MKCRLERIGQDFENETGWYITLHNNIHAFPNPYIYIISIIYAVIVRIQIWLYVCMQGYLIHTTRLAIVHKASNIGRMIC